MASPVSALLPPAKHGQPPNQRGGTTEVPEDAVQDLCMLLWGLPLAIVFFTIVLVVVVTVGKGGHSLGAMECAPSFWLPWKAWWKWGECGMMVVGCDLLGTEQGHFLGQEKLTYGHDRTNFGTEQGDFLGQEKSTLGLFEMNYGK